MAALVERSFLFSEVGLGLELDLVLLDCKVLALRVLLGQKVLLSRSYLTRLVQIGEQLVGEEVVAHDLDIILIGFWGY